MAIVHQPASGLENPRLSHIEKIIALGLQEVASATPERKAEVMGMLTAFFESHKVTPTEIMKPSLEELASARGPRKVAVLRMLADFFVALQVSREQVVTSLTAVAGGYEYEWLAFIQRFETSECGFTVLPPLVLPAPSQLDPQRSLLSAEDQPKAYKLSESIVMEAANTEASILILGPSRGGKSTLLLAILAFTLDLHERAEIRGLDLQALKLLGLQRTDNVKLLPFLEPNEDGIYPIIKHSPNTITQVTSRVSDHMLLATEAIKEVWNIYEARSKSRQHESRTSPDVPEFHLLRFLINEWNIFFRWANTYGNGKQERADFAKEARARGIVDPLYPLDAVQNVDFLISSGAELKVSVVLVAQDYTSKSTGFSPCSQDNMTIIAVGRKDEKGQGGYGMVSVLTSRPDRIKDQATRQLLGKVVAKCIEADKPVLISTAGSGSAGVLPDYSDYQHQWAGDAYKWPVI